MSDKQEDVKAEITEEETGKINYTDFLRDTEEIEAEIRKEEELKRQKRKEMMKILPKANKNDNGNAEESKKAEEETDPDAEALKRADIIKYRAIAVFAVLAVLIFIYFGVAYGVYGSKFLPSTVINDVDCSGKTVDEVSDIMAEKVLDYHLSIMYNDIMVDELYGKDIDLEFGELDKALEDICAHQKKLSWLKGVFFNSEHIYTTKGLTYDTLTLSRFIDSSLVLGMTGTIESEDARLEYIDDKYEIIPEVQGDSIDKAVFSAKVTSAVLGLDPDVDINRDGLFIKPGLTADNKNIIHSCKTANKLIKDKLELNITDDVFEIPIEIKKDWFCVDREGNLALNEAELSKYMDRLDKSYGANTEVRTFKTFYGDEVTVTGGDFGTGIDRDKLKNDVNEAMFSGKDSRVIAEFAVFQKDIGKSYIEVDLSNQMLWMYKDGELILSTPVITGRDIEGCRTPEGVYRLKSKTENTVIKEKDEEHTVNYFMSVNGGYGICDAKWKNLFGGQVYKEDGSDGSVYVLEDASKTIYENCYENMPVIYYTHEIMDGFYFENSYMGELMDLIANRPEIPEYNGETETESAAEETTENADNGNSSDSEDNAQEQTAAPLVDSIMDNTEPEEEEQTVPEQEAPADEPAENEPQEQPEGENADSSAEEDLQQQ